MTRILICDDSFEDSQSLSAIIDSFYNGSANGGKTTAYSLAKFYDPREAEAFIEDGNKIDIAILDIMASVIITFDIKKHSPHFDGRKCHEANNRFSLEDFEYDEGNDCYHCPNGTVLAHQYHQKLMNSTGHKYQAKRGTCCIDIATAVRACVRVDNYIIIMYNVNVCFGDKL